MAVLFKQLKRRLSNVQPVKSKQGPCLKKKRASKKQIQASILCDSDTSDQTENSNFPIHPPVHREYSQNNGKLKLLYMYYNSL